MKPQFPLHPVFVFLFALLPFLTAAALGETNVVTSADAMVQGGTNANTNSGTLTTLQVKDINPTGDVNRKAYLKFDLTGVPMASVASLRLVMTSPGGAPFTAGSRVFEVYGIADGGDGWTETGITWNNAPGNDTAGRGFLPGATLLGTFATTQNTPNSTPVFVTTPELTAFLNNARGADNLVTLAIRSVTPSNEGISFASLQNATSASRPRLILDSNLTLPASPSGLSATANNLLPGVVLAWSDNASNEDNYVVVRATIAGGPYTNVTSLPANSTSFNDLTAPAGVPLYYVVRALNARGASADSNEATATLTGADFHVSPDGVDQPPPAAGTLANPFKTINYASTYAVAGSTVFIHAGTYRETITPVNSGTAGYPIMFKPYNGEEVIISGLDPIIPANGATWQQHSGEIYKIQLTSANGFATPSPGRNLVFCDGALVAEARWPNASDPMEFRRQVLAASDSGALNVANGANSQGTYTDSYLNGFVTSVWTGATMRFTPGWGWSPKLGTITTSTAGTITFTYSYSYNGSNANWDRPGIGDPYFLFGRLVALDAPNEAFFDDSAKDGAQYMLYLWKPDGGSPVASMVEMRKRTNGIDLSTRTWVRIENLHLLASAVTMNASTANCTLDRLRVDYGIVNWANTGNNAVTLAGTNNQLLNSEVRWSTGNGISVDGTGGAVRNCVVRDCVSVCLSTPKTGTGLSIEQNTAFNSGDHTINAHAKASRFIYNHAYNTGLFTTDLAVINAFDAGDGQGTEIGWSWAHDNLSVLDSSKTWNGGAGIRLDSGSAATGCSNYVIHHNLVWNTTQTASIALWALLSTQLNYGNCQIRAYNNTCDNELRLQASSGSAAGMDLRNNLMGGQFNAGGVSLTGVTLTQNISVNAAFTGNLTGSPGFVSPSNRNFQLRADSQAVDAGAVIAPYTDGFTGATPDIGALEHGVKPFTAGALLLEEHLAGLSVSYEETLAGQPRFVVSGLPVGRSLPPAFKLKIGSAAASGEFYHRYDFTTHTAVAVFEGIDPAGMSGPQGVQFSLDGASFVPANAPVNVTPFGITSISAVKSLPAGGATVVLTGHRFSAAKYRTPITLSQAGANDLVTKPVLLTLDTAALVAVGRMRADGGDIRFADAAGRSLVYWLESGMNTAQTRIWVRYPEDAAFDAFSGEDASTLYLSYGDGTLTSQSDQNAVFPGLARSSLRLRLRAASLATSLADGAPVAAWPDLSGNGRHAQQATATKQPAFRSAPEDRIGGLPVVRFDGGDWFDLATASLGEAAPFTTFSIYANPDPGSGTYQRLYSAMPTGTFNSSNPDGVTSFNDFTSPGWSYFLPYTGSGIVTASTVPQFKKNTHGAASTGANFRVGGQTQSTGTGPNGFFKGDLAEMLVFGESLPVAIADNVETYLRRTYFPGDAPSLAPDFASTTQPLTISIGGIVVTGVVVGDGTITFTAPGFAGAVNGPTQVEIVVTNANGQTVTIPSGFYYYTEPVDGWRIDHFYSAPGGPAGVLAQDAADPNDNGLVNLLEYALGGDPLASGGAAVLPAVGEDEDGHLTLSFQHFLSRSDLTLTVQGADTVTGWTDLARSIGGAPFTPLEEGVDVSESGDDDARAVTVSDRFPVTDPAHPRRYLRLKAER